MLPTLLALLVFLFVGCVVFYIAQLLIAGFKIPQPFAHLAYAAVLLVLLFLFLSEIGWAGSPHGWRSWR